MLQFAILGVREGTLRAVREGLYWRVEAWCSRDWAQPVRLLARTPTGEISLGVPQPQGERLWLRTSISDRCCHFTPQMEIVTDQSAERLYPFEPEKPFAHIAAFSVMRVVRRGEALYWAAPADWVPEEAVTTAREG